MATKKTRLSMSGNSHAVKIPKKVLAEWPPDHSSPKNFLGAAHGQSEEVLDRLYGPGSPATTPTSA